MKDIRTPDAQRFRAQATGIGSTRAASEWTGRNRAQRVIDCAPPEQRKHASGYPAPTPVECAIAGPMTAVIRRGTLRR